MKSDTRVYCSVENTDYWNWEHCRVGGMWRSEDDFHKLCPTTLRKVHNYGYSPVQYYIKVDVPETLSSFDTKNVIWQAQTKLNSFHPSFSWTLWRTKWNFWIPLLQMKVQFHTQFQKPNDNWCRDNTIIHNYQKIQSFAMGCKNHGNNFLGQERLLLIEFREFNDKCSKLLWNFQETLLCHMK